MAPLVKAELETARKGGAIRRLWARDASLWTGEDENKWLAWLGHHRRGRKGAAGPRRLPRRM